jgi:F-type H+-transporting ATPase subunit gamma
MPSLKALKMRIGSVKNTQKITKAMKMVAASKLRRAQEAAEAARPYAVHMDKVIASLASKVTEGSTASPLLSGSGNNQTHLMIVATSERGLCGGFNTNIVKAARIKIQQLLADGKTVKILCVGKKGRAVLQRTYRDKIVDTVDLTNVKKLGFADAASISNRVQAMYAAGEFDIAWLYYSRFKSVMDQVPTEQQLIPVANPVVADATNDSAVEYEPEEEEILAEILPRNVSVQIYKALLENAASEQGARMSAMDSATRNAGDMIKKLTLVYNRSRQAVITKELIEIISGAEAL